MKNWIVTPALTAFTLASLTLSGAALAKDETFDVAPARSIVQWTGAKVVGGSHTGKVTVKQGSVTLSDGKLTKGDVTIDMTSIVNEDLTDKEFNGKLVGHLKSADFFDVEKHPTAVLKVDKAVALKSGEQKVHGTLTIKGKSKPVTFTVKERADKGGKIASTELVFDRTDFDVRYGSGKFFQNLGDKVIKDEVRLEVELALEPAGPKSAQK